MFRRTATGFVAMLASSACAQSTITITASAPQRANPGDTYDVDVFAQVSGPDWVQGTSAVASFNLDLLSVGITSLVSNFSVNPVFLFPAGSIVGQDVIGASGFQPPNLNGANPLVDLSNPLFLFSIRVDVLANGPGFISFLPSGVPGSTLSFYPDSTQLPTIQGVPHPEGLPEVIFVAARTRIIPAPSSVAALALMAPFARARRPQRSWRDLPC